MTADENHRANRNTNTNNAAQQQDSRGERRKHKRKRLDPYTARVVVVGAGLAGLSTALSLRKAGFRNVEIYERDPSLEHQKEGYGLTLTYNPKGPLADLGVLETVAQRDCPSRSHYLFRQNDPSGTEGSSVSGDVCAFPMGYFGNAFFKSSSSTSCGGGIRRGRGQRGNLRVPRRVLRQILYDELQKVARDQAPERSGDRKPSSTVVHWNRSLVDFCWDEAAQNYKLVFAEHRSPSPGTGSKPCSCASPSKEEKIAIASTADLLVAADGIRSAILQKLYREHNDKNNNDNDNDNKNDNKNKNKNKNTSTSTSTNGHHRSGSTEHSGPQLDPVPSIREHPEQYGLNPTGIRMILGIADGIDHPLLRERGFYTIDTHGHRLFTMPYKSNRFGENETVDDTTLTGIDATNTKPNTQIRTPTKHRIMWQLSFAAPSNPQTLDSLSLRKYALETFGSWHPPVLDLVLSTPPSSIWGTDLMDRDPRRVYRDLIVGEEKSRRGSKRLSQPRLVVCGDALHSMTPFKGQGANQALADGPLLARWLSRSSVDAALTNWWRETLNRTAPVVEASRKAAVDWHDPSRILGTEREDHQEYHGFAGVRPGAVPDLVRVLEERRIGPHLGGELDDRVRGVLREHGWFEFESDADNAAASDALRQRVLELAASGDTPALRVMSLPSSGGHNHHRRSCAAMIDARDGNGRTCLHLAARGKHAVTCSWLVEELRILEAWGGHNEHGSDNDSDNDNDNDNGCLGPRDDAGKTAYDYARECGSLAVVRAFESVVKVR